MGNRSYLYLLDKASHQEGEVIDQIAEANNNLPLFWQILLTDATEAEAIRDQRVFGDANSPDLEAELALGIARMRRFLTFAKTLPGVKKIRHWPLYAQSLLEWLEAMQADHPEARISANIDEMLWLHNNGSIDEAMQHTRREFNLFWQQLDAAITAGNKQAANDLLLQEIQGCGQTLADWDFWRWQFGIGGIEHPYFEDTDEETVRDMPFSQFDTRGGIYLGHGAETFIENNLVGIRARQTHEILLPAEYDLIKEIEEYSHDENVWTCRGELWGIVRLHQDDDDRCTATEVRAPDLEDIAPFRDEENLAVAKQGGLYGWLDRDGQWVIPPRFSDANRFSFGLASAVAENDLVGYVDRSGEWVIPPRFWSMAPFESCGLAAACMAEDQPWGLISRQGEWVVEPTFEDIDWDDRRKLWETVQGDKHGWLHPDGQNWLEPLYDEITNTHRHGFLEVRQDKQWGICNSDGILVLPCKYRAIEIPWGSFADEGNIRFPDWFIVGQGKTKGMITVDGQWVIPAQFTDIQFAGDMLQHFEHRQTPIAGRWQDYFIVTSTGKKAERKQGLWSVARQALTLPLEYDAIWPVVHPVDKRLLLFTFQKQAEYDDGSMVVHNRVWHIDGQPFFPGEYYWFDSRNLCLEDSSDSYTLNQALNTHWPATPLLALRTSDSSLCYLFPDGHEEDQNAFLLAKAESGSVSSAWEVGRDFFDRIDDPECAAQAFKYLLVAAEKGLHVLGKNYQEAVWRLAYLQIMGIGTDTDPVSARACLERAYKPNGKNPSQLMVNLGYLYTEGLGGETRKAEALALFERAASEYQDDVGAYNAADMLENGEVGEIDLPRALDYFRLSAREGYAQAFPRIGNILQKLAYESSGEQQGDLYHQAFAAYREAEQQDLPEEAKNSLALNLGRLLLRHLPDESTQDEAVVLLQTAAESGEQEAIDILATEVFGPNGCRPDAQQASRWQAASGVPSHQKGFIMPLLAVIFGVAFVWLLLRRG